MMKKIMYLSAGMILILSACEQSDRRTTDDNERTNYETRDERSGDDKSQVEKLFTTTYEDLVDDKQELEKDLMELKQERAQRAGQRTAEYDSLVKTVEEKIQTLDKKAQEFRSATNDDRKDKIKDEFDMIENEASDRIRHIRNTYKKNS